MWISDTAIKRPVFATMTILSFVVLGLVSMGRLGIDLFPEVNFPFINVGVVFPGAAPEEVESLVTQRIEDAVSGINGVKRVISTSTEGFSRVGVELRLEVDPQAAAAEVRDKVAAIRGQLPPDIEDPTIQRFDVAALPVMIYAVGSSLPSDRVRRQVEDALKPLLEQIDGVAAVEINGGQVREVQVNLDPRRLEALGMPITEVTSRLAAENLDLPGGSVERDGRSVTLRTKGQFRDAGEIADVILRSEGGSTVRVRDVGTVVDGFEDRTTTTRLDGADAVSFAVRKQSGANTVEITDRVAATIARLEHDHSLADLQIRAVHNDADFIKENVRDVRGHILFGGLMAVVVIFLFMRDWRSTLITALALPTSVIATFFFMYVVGFTFNMMSLMALSLVIGILIDDAVVVRENIYRHMEMGKDPTTAAREGTAEIGLAVMATTFTILAVFLPVGFMTGIVGQFFKQFALTIAFAVAMSLLVAFTLDPMLSSRFVRFIPPEERRRTTVGRFLENWGAFYDRLDQRYHRLLGWAVDHPWSVVAMAAVVFFASLGTLRVVGTEFVPLEDRGQMEVLVELPPGTSFSQSEAAVAGVETVVRGINEVRQIFTTVGVNGDPLRARLQVKTTPKTARKRGMLALKADARARLANVRMMKATVTDPEFMQGAPSEAPVNIFVRGDDMVALQRLSDEVVSKVRQVPGAVDVDSSLEGGQPEMVAQVNRSRAADLGFDIATVALQLRGMVEGVVPTKLRDGEDEYDIRVRLAPEFRNDFAVIARTPLYSPRGIAVRTGDIVTMEPSVGPTNIEREQRRRQAKIAIELDGRALGDVTADLDVVMRSVAMPPNFEWGYAGDVEMMQESAASMGLALLLAIAFIYIVLASQFESFAEPLLIMLSLPLAVVGALLAMLVTGNNLGMPAMIGMVMLMGLVTKNAILLVDLTNHYHREDGLSVRDAILKAGPVRLRPILMTTFAMILGMMPSAMATGDGSEFRAPISIATIGGLITSTALTLLVVPVAYLLLARFMARLTAWRGASRRRMAQVTRVAGMLALMGLAGWAWTSTAYGQTTPGAAPMPLTFDQAIERALTANETLRVSEQDVRIGEARVTEARAAFLPSAALSYQFQPLQRFPEIVIPPGVFGPEEQRFEAAFVRKNVVQLDLSQPLYTGGRLKNARDLQQTVLKGSSLTLERARQDLQLRVLQAFFGALTNEQSVRVADEGITLAERQRELAQVRFEAGSVARLDVLRAEVDLANARARRIQYKAAVDQSHQALRLLLALPQSQALQLLGTLDDVAALGPRDALATALSSRPDLRAFESQRQIASLSAAIANAEWKPTVSLIGNVAYQNDEATRLLRQTNRNYTFGVALRLPLLAAPGAAARRAVAEAQVRQAEHGLRAALDAGRLELETAWTDLESASEVVTTQQKALELARESVAIAQVSYENGVITSAELSDAQVALLQTEHQLQQAKYARIVAAARARFAAGVS